MERVVSAWDAFLEPSADAPHRRLLTGRDCRLMMHDTVHSLSTTRHAVHECEGDIHAWKTLAPQGRRPRAV